MPRRNALTRALGAASSVNADLTSLTLLRGDRLTLCANGLHDMVDDKTIAEIMGSESFDLKSAARDLIDLANQAGGTDNITVALARFDEKNLEILDTKDLDTNVAASRPPVQTSSEPPRPRLPRRLRSIIRL